MKTTILPLIILLAGALPFTSQELSAQGPGGPGAFLERIFQGKDSIRRADMDPRMASMLDRFGITGDVITRQQLEEGFQKMRDRFQGGGGFQRPSGTSSSTGSSSREQSKSPSQDSQDRYKASAERYFRGYDKNGDGLLNHEEIQRSNIRYEKEKYDTNKDGVIQMGEWTVYIEDFMRKREVEQSRDRSQSSDSRGDRSSSSSGGGDSSKPKEDPLAELDQKPTVYYGGNLPEGLPDWFKKLDVNADGQVALYEWRDGGRSSEEFKEYDLNHDAHLPAVEVLNRIELAKVDPSKKLPSSSTSEKTSGRYTRGSSNGRGSSGRTFGDKGSRRDYGRRR